MEFLSKETVEAKLQIANLKAENEQLRADLDYISLMTGATIPQQEAEHDLAREN